MNRLHWFKRPFIWLDRFRHRCGYGVHSPFAFNLITDVIYEKRPYYAYRSLIEKERQMRVSGYQWDSGTTKVNRLLFRLVNRTQPANIVEVGPCAVSSLYLQSAKPSAAYYSVSDPSELFRREELSFDFLYLKDYRNPALLEKVFEGCVNRVTSESLLVIYGIGYSKAMKDLWKRLQVDERVGITFDLYDVGLLFFDRTKIKQHYIVNF